MFKNSRNTKKIIALFLVFTMMFANMFSVVQYAATTLGKQNSGEGHENVNMMQFSWLITRKRVIVILLL